LCVQSIFDGAVIRGVRGVRITVEDEDVVTRTFFNEVAPQ
jgi:hypothetical protein